MSLRTSCPSHHSLALSQFYNYMSINIKLLVEIQKIIMNFSHQMDTDRMFF